MGSSPRAAELRHNKPFYLYLTFVLLIGAPWSLTSRKPTASRADLAHEKADCLLAELLPHLRDMAGFSLASGLRAANVTGLRW